MAILGEAEKYLLQQSLYWMKESKKPESITDYPMGLARGFSVSFSVVVGWNNPISERLLELGEKISLSERRVLP